MAQCTFGWWIKMNTNGMFTCIQLIANFSLCAKKKRESSKSSYNWFFSVRWRLFSMYECAFLFCYSYYCCGWCATLLMMLLCWEQIKALKDQTKYESHEKNRSILFLWQFIHFSRLCVRQTNIESRDSRTSIKYYMHYKHYFILYWNLNRSEICNMLYVFVYMQMCEWEWMNVPYLVNPLCLQSIRLDICIRSSICCQFLVFFYKYTKKCYWLQHWMHPLVHSMLPDLWKK